MSDPEAPTTVQEPVTGATTVLEPQEPEPEISLTTKIVLIEGEQFSTPYDRPIETIRDNLAQTYPGIRTATVTKGTIEIEGVRYETVEFTKQAGTKGLRDQGHPLLPLMTLRRLPVGPVQDHRLVRQLQRGRLTFGEALELPLFADRSSPSLSSAGYHLCQRLEDLSAAAADGQMTVPGWSA